MIDYLSFLWAVLGAAVAGIVTVALMRQSIINNQMDAAEGWKRCDEREQRLRRVEGTLESIKTNLSWIRSQMEKK